MPPYGRGGAGNIQAVASERERVTTDLEANESVAGPTIASQITSTPRRPSQQNVYSGRGGAGNFYTVHKESNMKASYEVDDPECTKTCPGQKTRTPGRGGAGNFDFAANASEESNALAKAKDQEMRKEIAQNIKKDVEQQLAMPQKAKLAHTSSYTC